MSILTDHLEAKHLARLWARKYLGEIDEVYNSPLSLTEKMDLIVDSHQRMVTPQAICLCVGEYDPLPGPSELDRVNSLIKQTRDKSGGRWPPPNGTEAIIGQEACLASYMEDFRQFVNRFNSTDQTMICESADMLAAMFEPRPSIQIEERLARLEKQFLKASQKV